MLHTSMPSFADGAPVELDQLEARADAPVPCAQAGPHDVYALREQNQDQSQQKFSVARID
jgi:hypothetical protein